MSALYVVQIILQKNAQIAKNIHGPPGPLDSFVSFTPSLIAFVTDEGGERDKGDKEGEGGRWDEWGEGGKGKNICPKNFANIYAIFCTNIPISNKRGAKYTAIFAQNIKGIKWNFSLDPY